MDYRIEQKKDTIITGIKTRTDNVEGMTIIPETWEKFMTENTLDRIDNKVKGKGLYAVYTEYESDENGRYSFVIGAQTQSRTGSGDMESVVAPAGKYAVFTARRKENVIGVWQQIWQSDFKRTFISDYEYYNPGTGEVKVYVGIE